MTPRFARFPDVLPAKAGSAADYIIDPSRCAVRGAVPPALADRVQQRLDDEELSVMDATDAVAALPERTVVPVYTLGEGGTPFVPTGRLLVRFTGGTSAQERAADLSAAGYAIVEVPQYAPHAAWVEAESGDVADGLAGLSRLTDLRDVAHVEPQLLSPRAHR